MFTNENNYAHPKLDKIVESGDNLLFTLSNVDLSIANGIRRTILSDIPLIVFRTEDATVNKCKIIENSGGKLHNQILQQRLSCIPVFVKPNVMVQDKAWWNTYEMVIDVSNENSDIILLVTSEHFHLREIGTNPPFTGKEDDAAKYLLDTEVRKIFPPSPISGDYIEFSRLSPNINSSMQGGVLRLVARFDICTANTNSMFNAGNASIGNTMDAIKADAAWTVRLAELVEKMPAEEQKTELDRLKRDFYLLDARRYCIENSFDFTVRSDCVYTPKELVYQACDVLMQKCDAFELALDSNNLPIYPSSTTRANGYDAVIESTIPFCYDIILENETTTFGCILVDALLTMYFTEKDKEITYCAFNKFHPHNSYGVLRVAILSEDVVILKRCLKGAVKRAHQLLSEVRQMFL